MYDELDAGSLLLEQHIRYGSHQARRAMGSTSGVAKPRMETVEIEGENINIRMGAYLLPERHAVQGFPSENFNDVFRRLQPLNPVDKIALLNVDNVLSHKLLHMAIFWALQFHKGESDLCFACRHTSKPTSESSGESQWPQRTSF